MELKPVRFHLWVSPLVWPKDCSEITLGSSSRLFIIPSGNLFHSLLCCFTVSLRSWMLQGDNMNHLTHSYCICSLLWEGFLLVYILMLRSNCLFNVMILRLILAGVFNCNYMNLAFFSKYIKTGMPHLERFVCHLPNNLLYTNIMKWGRLPIEHWWWEDFFYIRFHDADHLGNNLLRRYKVRPSHHQTEGVRRPPFVCFRGWLWKLNTIWAFIRQLFTNKFWWWEGRTCSMKEN